MKKLCTLLFLAISSNAFAQNPTYQEKLYYSAKVWGFAKYYHSAVSTCQVNWDSVLVKFLPSVKAAATSNDFNDILDSILVAAGPMDIAVTPAPVPLPPELRPNQNFGWFSDAAIRPDVKALLDTIKNNFRPHASCWIMFNNFSTGYGGYLMFPHDSLMLNLNTFSAYPAEENRLLMLYKYWNVINYFNPYNYALDKPWDSSLYNYAIQFANASTGASLEKLVQKITATLNDVHVEGLTYNTYTYLYRQPFLTLRYMDNKYIVVKSGYSNIAAGDAIVSVDGLTPVQWEDSLNLYISAGNMAVFRRQMCVSMLAGVLNSPVSIVYQDSLGVDHSFNTTRTGTPGWTAYYPNAALQYIKWTTLDCDIGYVNMGYLQQADVNQMYADLSDKPAIVFDIRNYPAGTAPLIADLMLNNHYNFVRFTVPDLNYPGSYSWSDSYVGLSGGSSKPYLGKVFILINQETQSHAEFSCMMLEQLPNVLLVGSQTAGADGNVSYFKLSNDKLLTGFTSLGVFYPNGDSTQRIGIVPDSIVHPTQIGVRHGRDEVLEKAMSLACTLSVPETNSVSGPLSVSPNPATEQIRVQWPGIKEEVTIAIMDITGRIVQWKNVLPTSGQIDHSLRLQDLSVGLYLLQIRSASSSKTIKFIKR